MVINFKFKILDFKNQESGSNKSAKLALFVKPKI